MSNRRSAVWWLLVPALSTCLAARAAPLRYSVDPPWSSDQGMLPGSSILSMTQTRDGYLWLGTQWGLVRFDGVGHATGSGFRQFPVFDTGNTPGLAGNEIVKLFEDSHGNLWIGTQGGGISLSQPGKAKVTRLSLEEGAVEGRLISIAEDTTGSIWLCTAEGQLYRYRDGKVDIRLGRCTGLAVDKSGVIWIGTANGRLIGVGPVSAGTAAALPVAYENHCGPLDFILASKHGGCWILAQGRIQKWNADRMERDIGPYPWPRGTIVPAACEDEEGNLIVGTYGDGVYWFDAEGKTNHLSGLPHGSILSLVMDREGCLWVGTDGGGLNRVKRQSFDVVRSSVGSTVQTVCEDAQGTLWIGYEGARIERFSKDTSQRVPFSQLSEDLVVRSLIVDRNQEVWAGTWGRSLSCLLRLQENKFQPAPGQGAFLRNVSALFQDRQGRFWIGCQGGLGCLESNVWKFFSSSDGLTSPSIRAIADDAQGNLWIGTERGGLNRLRDGHFSAIRKSAGLPGDDVFCLLVDDQDVLWAGTAAGLGRMDHDAWTRFTTADGLISDSISYMLEDGQGFLWLGSNRGLMRIPKQALNAYASHVTNSIPCRVYGKDDGLPHGQCTFGSQPAACRGRDGRLWFPTIRGLASIIPADLRSNTNVPPVVIESVRIDNHIETSSGLRAVLPRLITVRPGSERLEIDYASLNLAAPDRARFRYRLEPYQSSWIEAGDTRAAHYTRLPQGEYVFHVKACNEDGVWNEAGATLAVTVLPHFWQTWWFLAGAAVCVLGMIVGSVHYVSTQRLHRQLESLRQKEALEKERARIARDLHDQLGANLTQVALLSEMAEADKALPDEVEAHARQIAHTALETTRALDEIVWTVNPANDTLDGLINYICKYAQEYLALAGMRYRIEVPGQLPPIPITPEVRHNVFLGAKEAVNNVVKHAHASSAWVRLHLQPSRFVLEIQDDGTGLSPDARQKGRNGLRNMSKRMEDVGGSFSITPAPEGGTIVRLTAPLANGTSGPIESPRKSPEDTTGKT